jgi:hypothetical protein
MSRENSSVSMCKVVEQVFAGIVFSSMVAFVLGATVVMCLRSAMLLA